jgi:hypothetical protein
LRRVPIQGSAQCLLAAPIIASNLKIHQRAGIHAQVFLPFFRIQTALHIHNATLSSVLRPAKSPLFFTRSTYHLSFRQVLSLTKNTVQFKQILDIFIITMFFALSSKPEQKTYKKRKGSAYAKLSRRRQSCLKRPKSAV